MSAKGTRGAEMMDLEDRDPNSLSQHLEVVWEDLIGEPEGYRSPECAWRCSTHCFNFSKNCCYIFLSVILAPLVALCMGCSFACMAFEHIWCWTPCLRRWKIVCAVTRTVVTAVSQAVIVPICDALGHCLASVKVRRQILPDGPDHREDILLV